MERFPYLFESDSTPDTHTFLWFVLGDTQLSAKAKTIIEDAGNEKLVRPASYWEIAIKVSRTGL